MRLIVLVCMLQGISCSSLPPKKTKTTKNVARPVSDFDKGILKNPLKKADLANSPAEQQVSLCDEKKADVKVEFVIFRGNKKTVRPYSINSKCSVVELKKLILEKEKRTSLVGVLHPFQLIFTAGRGLKTLRIDESDITGWNSYVNSGYKKPIDVHVTTPCPEGRGFIFLNGLKVSVANKCTIRQIKLIWSNKDQTIEEHQFHLRGYNVDNWEVLLIGAKYRVSAGSSHKWGANF